MLLTREEAIPELSFSKPYQINTGVVMLKASAWTRDFLAAWLSMRGGPCADLAEVMPGEQGCLVRLLLKNGGKLARQHLPANASEPRKADPDAPVQLAVGHGCAAPVECAVVLARGTAKARPEPGPHR